MRVFIMIALVLACLVSQPALARHGSEREVYLLALIFNSEFDYWEKCAEVNYDTYWCRKMTSFNAQFMRQYDAKRHEMNTAEYQTVLEEKLKNPIKIKDLDEYVGYCRLRVDGDQCLSDMYDNEFLRANLATSNMRLIKIPKWVKYTNCNILKRYDGELKFSVIVVNSGTKC